MNYNFREGRIFPLRMQLNYSAKQIYMHSSVAKAELYTLKLVLDVCVDINKF